MRLLLRARRWLIAACLCAAAPLWAADSLLVLSEGSPAYRQTAEQLRRRLVEARPQLRVETLSLSELSAARLEGATVVVAIGTQAALDVSAGYRPQRLICALLTRQTYERLPRPPARTQRSAVFIDQPAARQVALVRAALPGHDRLAIVHGAEASAYVGRFVRPAQEAGLAMDIAEVSEEQSLYAALRRVLARPSVLVAVPDNTVYNNFTVQNVLLTAYREGAPVVGFSPSYVRAGAIAAVYSTPEQIGDQVARAALAALDDGRLPPPAYPTAFTVSTNPHVARSLSIELPEPAALEAAVRGAEERP